MTTYYSASTNGFYPDFLKSSYEDAGTWPADVVEVSDRWYNYLLSKQGDGSVIAPNNYGQPVLTVQSVDWAAKAEDLREILLSEAYSLIDDWKIELQLGTISDEDKASLSKWMAYIKELKKMDLADITDEGGFDGIDWPVKPSGE